LMVYVEIKLEYDSKRIFEKFKKAALHIPHLLECHLLSGDFDYLMKIRVADMAEYRQLLGDTFDLVQWPYCPAKELHSFQNCLMPPLVQWRNVFKSESQ